MPKQLSEESGKPMQLVLDEAIDLYRRKKFFKDLNYQVLSTKSDPKAWLKELEERKVLESSLPDGLEDES